MRTSADIKVGRAVDYAELMMIDVPPSTAGYQAMWMTHFYSYFARGALFENPHLTDTIRHFENATQQAAEAADTPWELVAEE